MMKILREFRRFASYQRVQLPLHPELDLNYLCDPANTHEISKNITSRKGVGNIEKIVELGRKLSESGGNDVQINQELLTEALKIPNRTHPQVAPNGDEAKVIKTIGEKQVFEADPLEFFEISKRLNLVRTEQLGTVCGSRSYAVLGELAQLEHALIKYTLNLLLRKGFKLISVPDVLEEGIIERCGMATTGARNQVYKLHEKHGPDLCMSGTSEMALASFFANKVLPEAELPLKLATVSRCYRAETSSTTDERGIYRVHQFTKVEMFAVTLPEQSDATLEEFRTIEEDHFSSLGLHLRTLDMPPGELGAPAYRKYDVEAWLPGRKMYGEVSSCSNCTDYQSRRLNIRNPEGIFLHTINGTACAIPRMLIAIVETHQKKNGTITVPEPLRQFMGNKMNFARQKSVPELKLIKNKRK